MSSFFRTALVFTGWSSLGGAAGYTLYTRKCKIEPLPPTDYLFANTIIARFNPNQTHITHDVCKRRVPLDKINQELVRFGAQDKDGERWLEDKDGALVTQFCRGLWSGWGYYIQRRYLERKYRGEATKTQLWTTEELRASAYEPGTLITDHFEVVAKTDTSIIVRAGDSPRIQEVRASDGLFELTAEVLPREGVVEFGLKSAFYNGLATPDEKGDTPPAMGGFVQWLHQAYDKLLMETAIKYVTR